MEFEERITLEPESPIGQYFNSYVISVAINLAVLEIGISINDSQAISLLQDSFLPIDPRFSSIMLVEDSNGKKQWKKVEVKLEDHMNVPIFPFGLSPESYDKYFDDYLAKIVVEKLPQNKPLWEIHIVKYPTSKAAGNIIFKLHHALGDGYSLIGALLSCLQRAENHSLPLITFPSRHSSKFKSNNKSIFYGIRQIFRSIFYTITDFGWSVLKSNFLKDDRSPIRSGNYDGVEIRPTITTTITFSLDQMKVIKTKLGVTINDVICGMIFFGTRLYMQEISQKSTNSKCTALVLLNTRMQMDYVSVKEMLEPDSKIPWGNRFAFLHIPIPKFTGNIPFSNPLDFVRYAHKVIKRKRKSFLVYLNGRLLEMVKKFKGHEMALANYPITVLYYILGGTPEELAISIISYMGKLRVVFGIKQGHIDSQKFMSCVEKAFETIYNATQNSKGS